MTTTTPTSMATDKATATSSTARHPSTGDPSTAALWRCGGRTCPPGTCDHDDDLQRHAAGPAPRVAPPIVHEVLGTSGSALPAGVRNVMEGNLGHDFSSVRIHTDAHAAESARAVNAVAYTVGRDIVFGTGQFAPATSYGRRVLTHELAHVLQGPDRVGHGPIAVSDPHDPSERSAEALAAEGPAAEALEAGSWPTSPALSSAVVEPRGPSLSPNGQPRLRRLGANPGCTRDEAADIHQAIFDARGWLAKAVTALGQSPLPARAVTSLRQNFGPTYGVAANAVLIRDRLVAARTVLSTMPISCAGVEDATCATAPCGYTPGAGSQSATICRNVTLDAGTSEVFQAGCVLHESFHATFARFDVDSYSGWHGHSGSTAGYPGAGVEPLLNADSYTTLVMDLS